MRKVVESVVTRVHHRVVLRRPPSFHGELCRIHRICDQMRSDGYASPVHFWETKLGGREIARRAGIPTTPILQGPIPPADVDWASVPDRFVVKPVWGSAREGVLLLERRNDAYFELLRGETMTSEAVVEEICGRPGEILLEEFLNEPPHPMPDDWKFYTFNGRVELVLQIRRQPTTTLYRFYDGSWNDAGKVEYGMKCSALLTPPRDPVALTDAARRLSIAARIPFVRVDLYETDRGVVFGELTPRQSVYHRCRLAWDARLGRAWERAEAELGERQAMADGRMAT